MAEWKISPVAAPIRRSGENEEEGWQRRREDRRNEGRVLL
jgi:hypothetical protein